MDEPVIACPVRCFTCSRLCSAKYVQYRKRLRELQATSPDNQPVLPVHATSDNPVTSVHGRLLDELGVYSICCRRILLTTNNALYAVHGGF